MIMNDNFVKLIKKRPPQFLALLADLSRKRPIQYYDDEDNNNVGNNRNACCIRAVSRKKGQLPFRRKRSDFLCCLAFYGKEKASLSIKFAN